MGVEVERKFLVVDDSWRAEVTKATRIVQGYLARTGRVTLRVRIKGEAGFVTIKGETRGISRSEFEYPIPLVDARALLQLCSGSLVEKNRHYLHHQGHLWEVDEFLGDNAGLVVAELELDAVDEVFARPAWLGAEVTDQPRYYNLALASHPYTQWPATQRHDPD